ncbi:MAG: hypothetical protein R3B47_15330 [Bacteroidia bacterium]
MGHETMTGFFMQNATIHITTYNYNLEVKVSGEVDPETELLIDMKLLI